MVSSLKDKIFYQEGLRIACCESSCTYEDEPKLAREIAKSLREFYEKGFIQGQNTQPTRKNSK